MYTVRALQFYLKGKAEFTLSGYNKHSLEFDPSHFAVNLSGKSYIVTGGNSGIGFASAQQLLRLGAHVHIVCRNKQRGEVSLNELKQLSQQVSLHLCDLGEFSSIRSLVQSFHDSALTFDGIVHNAGQMNHELQKTSDGFESNFAANVAGVFLLTELLIPKLLRKPAKIILVSSGGMYTQPLQVDDFNMERRSPFDGLAQYAINKRQQVALCEKWAQKYPASSNQIFFYSMHPGWVDTPAVASSMPEFYNKHKALLRTPDQGADTITWLLCRPDAQLDNAAFYLDRKPQEKHLTIAFTSHNQKDLDIMYDRLAQFTGVVSSK